MGDAATSDILQQALVNSGLTATHIENGQGDGVSRAGDAVSSMSMTEALMSNVAAFSRLDGTVSTMAIHDSATGHVKRHIIRKVSLSLFYEAHTGKLIITPLCNLLDRSDSRMQPTIITNISV